MSVVLPDLLELLLRLLRRFVMLVSQMPLKIRGPHSIQTELHGACVLRASYVGQGYPAACLEWNPECWQHQPSPAQG